MTPPPTLDVAFDDDLPPKRPLKSAPDLSESFEVAQPVTVKHEEVPNPVLSTTTREVSVAAEPRALLSTARTLPHSLEAEEHVLSCCLMEEESDAIIARCQEARLRADDFYDPRHGIIYAVLLEMHGKRLPVSVATLAEELKSSRRLEQVGGYPAIVQISDRAPTTAQASYFIRKLKDQSMLREIIRTASTTIEDCYACTGDLPALTADLKRRMTFAVEGAASTEWPSPCTASDTCDDPPLTPATIIDGMLYAPGTMLISGPSKSRKTFTSLDIAVAISTGSTWLGHRCNPTSVLYLNLELQDFATARRLADICSARGIPPPANLHLCNLRGHTVDLPSLRARLPGLIAKTGASCVIIDPHYKISSVSGMEESSNDDQGYLLSIMEGLCHQAGAALILTHHFAKGDASAKNAQDRASGAGAFTRWPDVFVTFTPHEEEDSMTIDFFLRNFAPVPSFVVTWEYPRWQTRTELDPTKLKHNKPGTFQEKVTADQLLECLGTNIWTAKEWLNASGVSERTFHRKRKELSDTGKIKCFSGCYQSV